MEDFIPFLIIVASGIISLFASAKKKKHNNKNAGAFELDDSSTQQDYGESFFQDEAFQGEELQGEGPQAEEMNKKEPTEAETLEEKKQQILKSKHAPDPTKQKERGRDEKREVKQPRHARAVKGKKKVPGKTGIERIKEKFDVKEAIIYSEIINRKYF